MYSTSIFFISVFGLAVIWLSKFMWFDNRVARKFGVRRPFNAPFWRGRIYLKPITRQHPNPCLHRYNCYSHDKNRYRHRQSHLKGTCHASYILLRVLPG